MSTIILFIALNKVIGKIRNSNFFVKYVRVVLRNPIHAFPRHVKASVRRKFLD